eukprot:Seg2363.3 transcript_id=Seg2363.3/GoldUCD/mRNA.D3Y31 product="Feline leukemia virus subgroup C receptor-related protein 2" protein_id=Seg2363.3/GoldUCD/D3Y31
MEKENVPLQESKAKAEFSIPTSSSENNPNDTTSTKFILYKRRWVILAVFSMISMMNQAIWISLSSVTIIVQEYYNVHSIAINWLAMLYMLLYIFVLASSFILDKYGLKITIIMGAMLSGIGSCFRAIGANRDGFSFIVLGQVSAAFGQSFLLFLPPRLAAIWFPDHERATASSIGMLMSMSGVAVGYLMGSTIVPNSKDMNSVVRHGVYKLLFSEAIICTFLALTSVLVIRDAPPTPPSRSQALRQGTKEKDVEDDAKRGDRCNYGSVLGVTPKDHGPVHSGKAKTRALASELHTTDGANHSLLSKADRLELETVPDFRESFKLLWKDKQFHIICQAYGLFFGVIGAYSTVLNQMVTAQYPGKEKDAGYMGFSAVICGISAMLLVGRLIDKTRQYKIISQASFAICAITMLIFTLLLTYYNNFEITFLSWCVFGFFSLSFMTAGLEQWISGNRFQVFIKKLCFLGTGLDSIEFNLPFAI